VQGENHKKIQRQPPHRGIKSGTDAAVSNALVGVFALQKLHAKKSAWRLIF